jgi:hypothetical protein
MKDKTNQLIQVYDNEGEEIGIFKFTGNNCPEDHLETVFKEYFEYNDDENANMHLFRWGLERVYIEHEVILH